MVQSTTKRYKAVQNNIETLTISDKDLYQFGCEFEFYIDTNRYNLQNAIEEIKKGEKNETFNYYWNWGVGRHFWC